MPSLIQCRQCRVQKSCGSCFEPSTFARQNLVSGMRSALCKVCFARRQNKTESQIAEELREVAFELKQEQHSPDSN
ncbi:hypothetical protein IAD21_00706 [Abditibacteriota bacterium]|nr:hypothetical protein IAD21_00706 [Abditibacteriota bacterium]